ncbi:related to carnitine acetyl transferase FacC [Melanopsichium pennsylvanicum]|uniref:Related to carnitine acetyl transferase FacC n=2 Tax=Melanopsichium pennsylvanicum TaxID=63383 RepID=A0AAJ4XI42_9BASI|nr:related to carnitine acetyl transferase FacC [Melanopsichium pennsylvanicum 4]SNX83019.1 related to carnitine acetyl transferase FacC [Melanopsichium pennsylvanicum]
MAPGLMSAAANGVFNAQAVEAKSAALNDGGAKEGLGGGKTFQGQSELPHLPIPALEDTCQRYLSSLQPLQTPEQHATTKRVVQDFLKNDGPAIQKQLEQYASTRASYIEEFWDESYLQASDSVVLNLNPFFILEDDPTPTRGNQLMRTANLILASLAFIHDLRTGVLEPDSVRGTPLDMFQYTRLFATSRIPTANGCRMETESESRHVVVMRRGQIYWFEALDDEHRPLLTERAMLGNLQAIVRDADKIKLEDVAKGSVGILTTEKRPIWSMYREHLRRDSHNRKCLEVVDSALFVVCMDDSEPADAAELGNNMLCGTYKLQRGVQTGTCTNRWYDKLQIIVCANGTAGVNFEHTGVDGHTVLRYAADVYTELIMRFAKSINSATKSLFKAKTSPLAKGAGKKANGTTSEIDAQKAQDVDQATAPKKLEWNLTRKLADGIKYGETRLSDLICQNECQVLEFDRYGKNFITRHRFSPDAFVQMAFQAAYYTLYGRCETTYEPAMTKAFLHGRTEAIRTVQPHSAKFVETYISPESDIDEKLNALRKACEGHAKLSKACASGQGHDRHLYALHNLWKKQQAESESPSSPPAIFTDSGYATLNHTVVSTSNCGNPALRMFGFGPVVPDGFGIGYIIKDDAITVCASSKHLQTKRYLDTLEAYLVDTQRMIIEMYKAANVRSRSTYIDHAGVECDVRTGLPIGSKSNGYSQDYDELPPNSQVGQSGYSFFGDDARAAHAKKQGQADEHGHVQSPDEEGKKTNRKRLASIGKTILYDEYN